MNVVVVNEHEKEVAVRFNTAIYAEKYVDAAVKDFESTGTIEKRGDLVILKPKREEDLDTIGYELCNHVLRLIKTL